MKGFDPKWTSPEDYILGITKKIWEDREIGSLTHYYAPDIVVRSPASVVVGNTGIIGATMATLSELPDRQLLGEDVIWCDAPDGFLSSHRLTSTATHSHPGVYGQPTGKKIQYRILADCHCQNDQVNDEWLVRDQGAIVRQLGMDPKSFAAELIAKEGGAEHCVQPYTPSNDVQGPYNGRGNDHPRGHALAGLLTELMAGNFAAIGTTYDRACQLSYPSGVDAMGREAADQFWLGLRAALPNAAFTVHHQIGMEGNDLPPRAAVRWSLHGKHEGWGAFGTPTGADIFIMGITHAEFGPWGLRREFTLIDETAVWKQILLQTG